MSGRSAGGSQPYQIENECSVSSSPHILRRMWGELDTEHSFSIWYGWDPPAERPDMAFSVEGNVYLATYAIWDDPAKDEHYRSWVHERIGAIAARGEGVYLGDTDFTRRADRFLSEQNFTRLEELRAQWDPDGRFCSYLIDPELSLNTRKQVRA